MLELWVWLLLDAPVWNEKDAEDVTILSCGAAMYVETGISRFSSWYQSHGDPRPWLPRTPPILTPLSLLAPCFLVTVWSRPSRGMRLWSLMLIHSSSSSNKFIWFFVVTACSDFLMEHWRLHRVLFSLLMVRLSQIHLRQFMINKITFLPRGCYPRSAPPSWIHSPMFGLPVMSGSWWITCLPPILLPSNRSCVMNWFSPER